MSAPGRKYEVAFNWNADGTTFVDESGSAKHFATKMGRNDEMGRIEAGTALIVLENGDGRFTPEYASGPLYGQLELERRARVLGYLADGVTTKSLFYGFISDIEPDPLSKKVTVYCQDWSPFLQAFDLNLGPLENKTTGFIIGAILDEVGFPAGGTWRDLDTGQTTLTYWNARNINAWDAIQEVSEHELGGIFYFDQAGKAVFEDRHSRALATVVNTWPNTIGSLVYRRRNTQVYAKAKIGLGGFEPGVAGSIIYSHSPLPLALAPGATLKLPINYSQPAKAVIAPVSGTDYVANAVVDGTGADRTALVVSTFTNYGGGAQWELRNDNLSTVHFQALKIRGTPLGLPADLRTVQRTGTALGALAKTFERQYRFLDDPVLAGSFADYIVQHFATPQPWIQTLLPVDDDALQQKLYQSRVSDRQNISDTAFPWRSNVNGDFFIEMIEHEADIPDEGEGVHKTKWALTSYLADQVWIMGVSLMGVDTIPGY